MKFPRTRRFYVLVSFVFVIILFLFSHWRSYKILVQNNHEKNSLLVQNTYKLSERGNEETEKDELKCRSQDGLQTSTHCVNKGDGKNILVYSKYDDALIPEIRTYVINCIWNMLFKKKKECWNSESKGSFSLALKKLME